MKKILSLSTKEWFSGQSLSSFVGSGFWFSAPGINPFIDATRGSSRTGLLQTSPNITNLTGSVFVDTPIGYAKEPAVNTDPTLYIQGTGTLYAHGTTSNNAPVALRTVSNLANGIGAYQPNGGTRYLYYWQKTQIGRYDFTSTYVDNQYTGLQSTVHHPVHSLFDVLFYGNKDRIGSLRDDGAAGVTHSTNDLNLNADFTCTTLADDGYYLVIGMTKSNANVSASYNQNKILFWDTNSSSWEKEYDLEANDIISIKRVGSVLYALTSSGLFMFNYSTPPVKVLDIDTTDASGVSSTYGAHYSMDVWGEGVLWGSPGKLHYYGKRVPSAPVSYHQLFVTPNTTYLVCSSARKETVYAGTIAPSFGFFDTSDNSTPSTGITAFSSFIDLGDRYTIGRIDVVLGGKLASGDVLNVGILGVGDTTTTNFNGENAVAFANQGAVTRVKLSPTPSTVVTDLLQLAIGFVGGAVRIKRIDIWGEVNTS